MRRAARSRRSRCAGPTRAGGEGAAGISVRAVFFLRNSRSPASAAAWIKAERQFVGTVLRRVARILADMRFSQKCWLGLGFLALQCSLHPIGCILPGRIDGTTVTRIQGSLRTAAQ